MDTTLARVLIVDDDAASRRLLEVRLRALNCDVATAANGKEGLRALQKTLPALILLDLEMPQMGGMELLRTLRGDGIDLPVIVITSHSSIEKAVEAMREGAFDFIPKPLDPKHLEIVVRKALERERLKRGVEILLEETGEQHRLVAGASPKMSEAIETAKKAAASNATVLLLGESGTGKEIFARAVHRWSERREEPFVAINCVGLSRELLESELFGHEKGAFTGAHQLKKGKIELAHGGTVFFDEIGDISAELQTKLLRFLEEREFERVGGTQALKVNTRIIAATNRDLESAVKEGRFREDLYHRLNVVPILLPPLRERREDIPVLVQFLIQRFSKETKKQFTAIDPQAQESLVGYAWPGNVRELANVIERAVVLGQAPGITPRDLPARITAAEIRPRGENLSYREAVNSHRRELVLRALQQSEGNRTAAAKALGLHEKYFLKLIKSLGIK
ncbi:MAG: Fis family transcriptional regulator [Deltaproteobacteria bacterium RIFCSPLOWO2_12_FULL_60_19]|nr:MAG: Fis family transcriptional regulator [Deltaproteobacteria bacterium RIFCSPLOWO2_12_FULL_60_19]